MALKVFTGLRKAYPLKTPGDEKVSDLEAALGGVSVEHVEKMRAMSDSELRSYARARVEPTALRFLQGGTAESRSGFEGQSAPATWRVDGDHLVVEASLDSRDEKAPHRDTPKYLIVIRFRLLEEALVVEDVQLTGFEEEEEESWFPRTWERAASRDG